MRGCAGRPPAASVATGRSAGNAGPACRCSSCTVTCNWRRPRKTTSAAVTVASICDSPTLAQCVDRHDDGLVFVAQRQVKDKVPVAAQADRGKARGHITAAAIGRRLRRGLRVPSCPAAARGREPPRLRTARPSAGSRRRRWSAPDKASAPASPMIWLTVANFDRSVRKSENFTAWASEPPAARATASRFAKGLADLWLELRADQFAGLRIEPDLARGEHDEARFSRPASTARSRPAPQAWRQFPCSWRPLRRTSRRVQSSGQTQPRLPSCRSDGSYARWRANCSNWSRGSARLR